MPTERGVEDLLRIIKKHEEQLEKQKQWEEQLRKVEKIRKINYQKFKLSESIQVSTIA